MSPPPARRRVRALARRPLVALVALVALVVLVVLAPRPLRADPIVEERVFQSAALGRPMRYRVLLPEGYRATGRRFPVLYLLHGILGDQTNWTTLSALATHAAPYPLLIVMPDGQSSWYANAVGRPSERFEDYLVGDLIAEADATLRTVAGREQRAIAGLSMGGYGALKAALRHPERFAFAGSLSGALDAPLGLERTRPVFRAGLRAVFGPPGSAARRANDVFSLLDRPSATPPYLYVACGSGDPFLAINRAFAARAQRRGLAYEYHELPGAHDWSFWDRQAAPLLEATARALGIARRP